MDYEILEKFYGPNSQGHLIEKYHIKCKICGHEKNVRKHNFQKGDFNHDRQNCKEDYLDSLINKKINDYVVKSRIDDKYIIQCSRCGVQTSVSLRTIQLADIHLHKHGTYCLKLIPHSEIKDTIITRFNDMFQRCNNPNSAGYLHYGERGIKLKYENPVDLYFDFYEEFKRLQDEGKDIKEYSFDRIDVNGDYEKENLRLTTQNVQNTNTTRKKIFILEKDGEKVICDNSMHFGRVFNINGRSIGNLVRGDSKTAFGWKLVRIVSLDENIDQVINNEGVTTKLITT